MNPVARAAMLTAALLTLTATAPKTVGWTHTVTVTPEGGHLIGNPDAPVRVVEYTSYACADCATFAVQSDSALQIGYVASGKVAVELRHLVQNPVDQAAAMLADCGAPEKFALNHSALIRSQERWRTTFERAGPAQRQRWTTGSLLARSRAIADDMGFYRIMESRDFDRSASDACLGDAAQAKRIGEQSKAGYALGIKSAPSFLINGQLLEGTHSWAELRLQIDASL